MPLRPERLAEVFIRLCEIDSPGREEGRLAAFLKGLFATEFKAEILEDDSAAKTGSDTGNLLVHIGDRQQVPAFFCNCHLDTVEPSRGIKVRRHGNTFTSAGPTILGADDKAGIAMLIELARCLKEDGRGSYPLEFVFTTCEEIGLLGAKNLDLRLVRAPYGFALDSAGIDLAVIGAPAANSFVAEVHGVAAHAGLHPENGVNAIQLASRALARLPLGRLDEESTANVGLISGGQATNIIPELARVEGEVRSHDPLKLANYTTAIKDVFLQAIAEHGASVQQLNTPGERLQHGRPVASHVSSADSEAPRPGLAFTVEEQFPMMRLAAESPVLLRLNRAADLLRRPLRFTVAGGGSDANVFSARGLPTAILGTGMTDVHTTDESITLEAMLRTTELLLALTECD